MSTYLFISLLACTEKGEMRGKNHESKSQHYLVFRCRKKRYLQELPTVSVIVIFYNEHWSTLLRTVYSVLNRSPPHLLKEIVMVNDHSTKEFLWKPLQEFVRTELPPKVKLINLPERSGLITARLAGAKLATGDVLIVLDSHTEVNVNWLPPLIGKLLESRCTDYQ